MMPSFTRFFSVLALIGLISVPSLSLADDTIYTKVDENPVPLKTPPPRYPDSLRREGVAGVVAVTVVIDEKGAIISSVVAKSSHPDFDKPALDAIAKWKFKPGKKDGTPVKVKATLPLRFNLDE
jgi:protein TonB